MPGWLKFAIVAGVLALLGWLAFGFFGIQALFYDREVDDVLPVVIDDTGGDNPRVDGPRLVGAGEFVQGDSTYTIAGTAFVSELEGTLTLSFSDFTVTNGPDLFVYAVATTATDNQTVKGAVAEGQFINLAVLKGNIGNQNYTLPESYEPEMYPVIAIWCRRFTRNFGSAYLAPRSP